MERQVMLRSGVYGCVLELILRCVDQFQDMAEDNVKKKLHFDLFGESDFALESYT
jgi:hypothetical protein